jgi:hypothetical protein
MIKNRRTWTDEKTGDTLTYEIDTLEGFKIFKESEEFRNFTRKGNFIHCENRFVINHPTLEDNCVLVYFEDDAIDMVHIEDFFRDITAGIVNGKQTYTKRYISEGVTHWMCLPEPPR